MSEFEKTTVEQIVLQLEERGFLFPQFELVQENNELTFLGGGGFSSVYEMRNKTRPGVRFALKVCGFERHTVSSEEFWNTGRLQWILGKESDYIVRMLAVRELSVLIDDRGAITAIRDTMKESWEEQEGGLHLQFVLMEKLEKVLEKDRFQKAWLVNPALGTETEVKKLALEIGQALKLAHDYNILHRDIKLENIFWDAEKKVYKLGDFGIAKYVGEGNAETVVYTDGYGAPEIERRLYDSYNATADIYSFGITLYLLLNELKFPGSDGYYPKAEVQYHPDYVFAAPQNASPGMSRIIRKMCSFRPKNRYQSMTEVLTDLAALGREQEEGSGEFAEGIDLETETYREAEKSEAGAAQSADRPKSRAERKEEEKLAELLYREDSAKYFGVILILSTLLLLGLQPTNGVGGNWLFLVLPVLALFEALLQKMQEFHLFFGVIAIGLTGFSACQSGITMAHVVLILAILVGCPVLTAAFALAVGCWIGLSELAGFRLPDFLLGHDLGWIFLVFLAVALKSYFAMRVDWGKTTYIRFFLSTYVYGKIFPLMAVTGGVLLVLQRRGLFVMPEFLSRVHLVRTGIAVSVVLLILWLVDRKQNEEGVSKTSEEGAA